MPRQVFWVLEIFYVLATTLIRASILLFYASIFLHVKACPADSQQFRVFPTRSFRNINSVVLIVVIASGASIILAALFQCSPSGKDLLPLSQDL
jgi:L-asparagine transporter-like permease